MKIEVFGSGVLCIFGVDNAGLLPVFGDMTAKRASLLWRIFTNKEKTTKD
jgi:hypothetical protein